MKIDINCDVGEGMANENLLMPFISSCNIACGGHFGTPKTIDATLQLAIQNNVLIGAHPAFPDKKNFGRDVMDISQKDLQKSIESQLELFVERASFFNKKLHHIKAHGALYNIIAVNETYANTFISAIKKYASQVFLYVPYASLIEKIALQNNIKIKQEAFADRNYTDTLTLVSRKQKNALITNPEMVYKHLYKMISEEKVQTISGAIKKIKATTFCIHGDTKNASEILKFITKELQKKGIEIA